MLTIRDHLAERSVPQAIHAGKITDNFCMKDGKMCCNHCDEPVGHPRAAIAHLARHHKDKFNAK